ncbi:hypothetical protein SEVIR_7G290950v4 [Setaria viridis]
MNKKAVVDKATNFVRHNSLRSNTSTVKGLPCGDRMCKSGWMAPDYTGREIESTVEVLPRNRQPGGSCGSRGGGVETEKIGWEPSPPSEFLWEEEEEELALGWWRRPDSRLQRGERKRNRGRTPSFFLMNG